MSELTISHPLIEFKIKLEKIEKLNLHEDIIPEFLEKLKKKVEVEGCIRQPVIVDEKTFIVLDGTHRVSAAKSLGCHLIPVCLVNYDNQNLLLDSWYRMIQPLSLEKLISSVKELKFKIESSQFEDAKNLVDNRKAITAIACKEGTYVVYNTQTNIEEIYRAINRIENKLRSKGFTISYETPVKARRKVLSKKDLAILLVPIVLKQEVKKKTLNENIFPPKSTRHVLPALPPFVNAELSCLRSRLTCEESNRIFMENLSKKRLLLISKEEKSDTYVLK